MEWMLDIQLGRRNLSPIQRIAVAEKYRPIYEKQARLNKQASGGDKKSEEYPKIGYGKITATDFERTNPTTDQKSYLILLMFLRRHIVWAPKNTSIR